jgi:hypothetical protein
MKYLLVLLLLVNFPARANWELVAENNNGDTFFVDFQTLLKQGSRVKFWRLLNYSKPTDMSGLNVLSLRGRIEIDCNEQTSRILTATAHSQNYAKGSELWALSSDELDGKWTHTVPNSTMWIILQRVCKTPAKP